MTGKVRSTQSEVFDLLDLTVVARSDVLDFDPLTVVARAAGLAAWSASSDITPAAVSFSPIRSPLAPKH